MPAITYMDWSGGLDLRLPMGVADANKLQRLRNAYVTAGKKISKRPGLRRIVGSIAGSVGLANLDGGLCVFVTGATWQPPTGVGVIRLTPYVTDGATALVDVLSARMFQGYPYIVAIHRTQISRPPPPPGFANIGGTIVADVVRHHYVDGNASTLITDTNCPHGASVAIAASRVFSTGGEVVRYSAIGAARDWTTASDAGFLPTSRQQDTSTKCTAVGTFDDALVVFFDGGSQVWDVAEDPSANQIRRRMHGVGTIHPWSVAGFYRDLVFASQHGIRSLAVQENVERLDESDIGVPVDPLVRAAQLAHETAGGGRVLGAWLQALGQYWVMYSDSGRTRAFVYSYSRSSKLMCWSEYTFPVHLTGIAEVSGRVYVRTANDLYELRDDQFTDDSSPIDVDVQMAFQDSKLPGVEKMFYGSDFVLRGTASVSYLFDPRDTAKETSVQQIGGDTRAGGLVGMEVLAAAVAPRFRHSADEAFGIDLLTLYFHPLSAQAS